MSKISEAFTNTSLISRWLWDLKEEAINSNNMKIRGRKEEKRYREKNLRILKCKIS
jgi:hypothetical protein